MKIGIITDIHSNVVALNEVLQQFEKRRVDKIICCGDIIGIGPYPEETVQILLNNKHKLMAVRGNHEQYLLNGLPQKVHDDKRTLSIDEIKNHEWTHSQLSNISKKFLKDLPICESIEIENKKIYITHYPVDENGVYKKHVKKVTIEDNKDLFSNIKADIYIYGHTHIHNINSEKNKWYINTGSLGCPIESNIANYGILTLENDKIQFESLNVEYNVEDIIRKIEKLEIPHYKMILRVFYGVK